MENEKNQEEIANFSSSRWFMNLDAPIDHKPLKQDFSKHSFKPQIINDDVSCESDSMEECELIGKFPVYYSPEITKYKHSYKSSRLRKKTFHQRLMKMPIISSFVDFYWQKKWQKNERASE